MKGPRPPPIGLTCAISNFARNSPVIASNIEFVPLELQRFWAVSKNDRRKLCATFSGVVIAVTLGCCGQAPPPPTGTAARPSGPSGTLHTSGAWCAGVVRRVDSLSALAPRPATVACPVGTAISHAIHSQLFQTLNSQRWNCNVSGLC